MTLVLKFWNFLITAGFGIRSFAKNCFFLQMSESLLSLFNLHVPLKLLSHHCIDSKTWLKQARASLGPWQWLQGWALHSFPFWTLCSFRSFKERNVLLRSFFEILVTYEIQKNDAFFYILFRSFLKNGKERKECNVLLQRT